MSLFKFVCCSQWRVISPAVTGTLSSFKLRSLPFCSVQLDTPCHAATAVSRKNEDEEEFVPERLYSMINIKVQCFEYAVLDSYVKFVRTAGEALGINIGGRVALPTHIQKFTVLKSAHIFKKHRSQYEIRTHSRLVQIKEITGTTADVFLEYIQRNLPEGVSMNVYQEELKELPKLLMKPLVKHTSQKTKREKRPFTS